MKRLKLTQGKWAKVDDEDFQALSKFKWFARSSRGCWYASRNIYPNGTGSRGVMIHLHVVLLGEVSGKEIDHIDRDGLNNQRSNLRHCTRSENCFNRTKKKGTHSKFVGVSWYKRRASQHGSWFAYIKKDGKLTYLGSFKSEEEAYQARKNAENRFYPSP